MNEIWSWRDIVRARQEGRRQGLREAAGVAERYFEKIASTPNDATEPCIVALGIQRDILILVVEAVERDAAKEEAK